jgi:lysophospholipase L1-like esterase
MAMVSQTMETKTKSGNMKKLGILAIWFLPQIVLGQNPLRFENEVERFKSIDQKYEVVFTGSSSVRLWNSLAADFSETDLINTGFGGSQTSDLIHYFNLLIAKYQPKKVFIYEGDNDIHSGKTPQAVMKDMRKLTEMIGKELPGTKVFFISAKPSPSRIFMKKDYEQLNKLISDYCEENDQLEFIDVWKPMLDEKGDPKADIFIEDQLHMNEKGYDIWTNVISPYLD